LKINIKENPGIALLKVFGKDKSTAKFG